MASRWSRVRPDIRRSLRAQVLARWGAVCHLCNTSIDVSLPRRHPGSYAVDHVVPPGRGGALLDPDNLRPAHWGCNSAKRDRALEVPQWKPKLEW